LSAQQAPTPTVASSAPPTPGPTTREMFRTTSYRLTALASRCENFSGAEIEQAIVAALYSAHAAKQPVSAAMIAHEMQSTRPLAVVMAEKVAALREWASSRTVSAD